MSNNGAALIAKAKAVYGRRITADEYNAMLHKTTVPQVVSALKSTPRYRHELASVDAQQIHRGQIELLLSKSVFETYMRLCQFVPGNMNGFDSFYVRKIELDIILNTIMFLVSGQRDKIIIYLPSYMAPYVSFDLMALAGVKSFDDLLKLLKDTRYYKILKAALPHSAYRANEKLDFEELSLSLYTDYYKGLLKLTGSGFSEAESDSLNQAVSRRIALDNLLLIYRMKAYFNRPAEEIKRLILPFYRGFSRANANNIINSRNADKLAADYLNKRMLKGGIEFDENFPEVAAAREDYRFFGGKLHLSQCGSMVIYSLVRLLEIEKLNIFTVIEGVRYALPAAEIEKLLVV